MSHPLPRVLVVLRLTSCSSQAVNLKLLWKALKDYDMWPIYLMGLTWLIPTQPITAYLTLIIRSLGFNTLHTNLLTVPADTLFILQLLFWTWFSEKINSRFLVVFVAQIWALPLLITLVLLPANANAWVRYAVSVLLYGFPYAHAVVGTSSLLWPRSRVNVSYRSTNLRVPASCNHESQRRICPNQNRSLGIVQHVCPS